MHRIILSMLPLLFPILFQGGCAQPLYWAKPGAQPGDFDRDVKECQQILGIVGNPGSRYSVLDPSFGTASNTIEQCLADRGWYLARKPKE